MYPFKENQDVNLPLTEKMASLKPYTIEEITESIETSVDKHFSFFVLPDGDVLDCRRPLYLTHLGVTDMIYENIDALSLMPECKHLKLEESAVFDRVEGPEQVRSTASAKDKLVRRLVKNMPSLFPARQQVGIYIADDEVLAQDLGWVKIVVFKDRNYTQMVVRIPNYTINGRTLKGAQRASITDIAESFGLDSEEVMQDALERNKLLTTEFGIISDRTIR